ncbi:MAG: branched-chain amino acid ABC transporter permease [Eubacteriales bacterium]|nr:branched-chain amino acid ABC transporter permease [Eubacteriales bacterium]MDD3537485.1 branched-chain amino acid ABC transporter permease [Eubacteriales bacterium]MDD4285875.1 branched-chain amino acid ABC transporter permease [Eubacteriales bacterium]HPF19089.1 branched-chain amino acid ABC transporter permease [Bacillota bacterium]
MSEFIQQAINGLRMGSVYALIALGYTMVYGIIRLINFAHGDFIMVGAYTMIFTIPVMLGFGLPAWTAVAAAVIVASAVGITTEAVAYRPVRKKGTRMSALITAIAMSLFLENLAQVLFTSNPRVIKASIFSLPTVQIGAVKIDGTTLATIAIAAVTMVFLQLFIHKTKMGRAMRAVSEDKQASVLMGINVNRTITLTFAIGSALAAVAALMYCAQYPSVMPTMGSMLGLKAFVAAVLGGIGIMPGAMLGGLTIGLVESLSKAYSASLTGGIITSAFSDAVVFAILIIVLLVKPAGILGKNQGEKV